MKYGLTIRGMFHKINFLKNFLEFARDRRSIHNFAVLSLKTNFWKIHPKIAKAGENNWW